MGTLRFDLNTLASTKAKDAKKDALAARKEFIRAVSALPAGTSRPAPFQPAPASPPAASDGELVSHAQAAAAHNQCGLWAAKQQRSKNPPVAPNLTACCCCCCP